MEKNRIAEINIVCSKEEEKETKSEEE